MKGKHSNDSKKMTLSKKKRRGKKGVPFPVGGRENAPEVETGKNCPPGTHRGKKTTAGSAW